MKFITTIIASAVLLTACGAARTPEEIVVEHYRAIETGNKKGMLEHVDPGRIKMLGENLHLAQYEKGAAEFKACGGIKSIEVELQGDEKYKTGKTSFAFNGKCPAYKSPVRLAFKDGKWWLV